MTSQACWAAFFAGGAFFAGLPGDCLPRGCLAGEPFSRTRSEFPVPEAPPGRAIDLDRVSVSIEHAGTGAAATVLGQARVSDECEGDAFFIRDSRIQLCPQVCDAVRSEEGANVGVLFGCESTIIVR